MRASDGLATSGFISRLFIANDDHRLSSLEIEKQEFFMIVSLLCIMQTSLCFFSTKLSLPVRSSGSSDLTMRERKLKRHETLA